MTEYDYQDDDLFEDEPITTRAEEKRVQTSAPSPAPKQPRKRDPQISLGGAKRAERPLSSNIALPKREKHEDMVLSGMADLGRKNMPKDSESAVHIGGVQRPKENDDVQIAKVQRPRDTDRAVKIGSTQRPKDSDGNISAGSRQRPKDDDGRIRVTRVPMPKDYGEQVKLSAKKKSNEEDTHKKSEFRWL